jgi:hypothetical protein
MKTAGAMAICLVFLLRIVSLGEAKTVEVPLESRIERAIVIERFLITVDGSENYTPHIRVENMPMVMLQSLEDFKELASDSLIFVALESTTLWRHKRIFEREKYDGSGYEEGVVYFTLYEMRHITMILFYLDEFALRDACKNAGFRFATFRKYEWDGNVLRFKL